MADDINTVRNPRALAALLIGELLAQRGSLSQAPAQIYRNS